MGKKTLKWEPTTEKSHGWDGVLKENVNMALLLGRGGGNKESFLFFFGVT